MRGELSTLLAGEKDANFIKNLLLNLLIKEALINSVFVTSVQAGVQKKSTDYRFPLRGNDISQSFLREYLVNGLLRKRVSVPLCVACVW